MPRSGLISSTSNPRVQRARRLKRRADRDETGSFLIETDLILEAALRADIEVRETFVRAEAAETIARCESLGLAVTPVADHVLKALAATSHPQDLVAVATQPEAALESLQDGVSLVLVLAEVRDPGNAGTLVRSAASAGADAVVFTSESVDPFAPKTVRASAGALFGPSLIRNVELDLVTARLAELGLSIYVAEARAGEVVSDVDLTERTAFIVGNEAHGVPVHDRRGARSLCIPMPGGTESLNVAVAGSILLYEAVRQRRATGG